MVQAKDVKLAICGACAGAVNGLFGAGGGMVLVPLLTLLHATPDEDVFHTSVAIILPICLVSLSLTLQPNTVPWDLTIPYLIGSTAGGIIAGLLSNKIPVSWLHRFLGIMVLWGGVRYLC